MPDHNDHRDGDRFAWLRIAPAAIGFAIGIGATVAYFAGWWTP